MVTENFNFLYLLPQLKAIVMIKSLKIYFFFLPIAVLFSCAEPTEQDDAADADTISESMTEENSMQMPSESSFQFDLIIANNVAAPVKLLTDMQAIGLNHYQDGITNPTDKLSDYVTADQKALAFGVYGADLSYKSLYARNQEMADYLIVIRKLSDDLGLTFLFDQESMEAFERIKSNPDSMKLFIFDKYDGADDYLRSNDRLLTATLVLTGGLIESLHIVSSQIQTGETNKDAFLIFIDQKNTLKSLIELFETMEKDGQKVAIKKDVETLYQSFIALNAKEMFTKESMTQLHAAIGVMRAKII